MEKKIKLMCYLTATILIVIGILVGVYGISLVVDKWMSDFDAEKDANPDVEPDRDYLFKKSLVYHFKYYIYMIFLIVMGVIIVVAVSWYYKKPTDSKSNEK